MRITCYFMLFLVGLFNNAQSEEWYLENEEKGWTSPEFVRMYFHNSELQSQWAWNIIGKAPFRGDESILDFGCGDGKLTAAMSQFVPRGKALGVDLSAEMLRFAKNKWTTQTYPNLAFSFAKDLSDDETFDVITSFCVFHLVRNPEELLRQLGAKLKPDGRLVILIPGRGRPSLVTAALETGKKYGIEIPFEPENDRFSESTIFTNTGCKKIMQRAGLTVDWVEEISAPTAFIDQQELITWCQGTIAANWSIPWEISEAFFTDFVKKLIEIDPVGYQTEEGQILWPCTRIQAVARQI
ncbi:MAG: methyltransferase domain-containing protein [Chlamydiales bacterium]|nr:methyltransferase domain-containing protein [Chlamydiales bacterium]